MFDDILTTFDQAAALLNHAAMMQTAITNSTMRPHQLDFMCFTDPAAGPFLKKSGKLVCVAQMIEVGRAKVC